MTKQCKTCKILKPLEEFAHNSHCADGHLTECKECNKIYRKLNAIHRAEVEKQRRRRLGIKPKLIYSTDEERRINHLKAVRKWQRNNKDKVQAAKTIWKEYQRKHRSVVSETAAYKTARSQARRALYGAIKWADKKAIFAIYKEAQLISINTGVKHVVDHYYPLNGKTVSGLHVHTNLQIIPYNENALKGNKHPDEFYTQP